MGRPSATPSPSSCALIVQDSRATCTLGVSFGCDAASQTMWVQNCRGRFQCLERHHHTLCGYPPGRPFYNCSCQRSRKAFKHKEVLAQRSESHFRNLTLFFHTANASQLVLEERTPDFTDLIQLEGWQRAIASHLDHWPKRGRQHHSALAQAATEGAKAHASCAVVGSAAALLTRNLGAEINAHETIIRTNQAPTRSYEQYVGNRTDFRVWGFIPLPRERHMKGPWNSEDNFLIYCPPVTWVSHCWRSIANDQDPRFHPSAWRRAQRLIHRNRTRCKHLGCYPSTGIMAVLYAVDACESVSVYGFGTNEASAQDQCACSISVSNPSRSVHGRHDGHMFRHISEAVNECGRQKEGACAVGRACDKYYPRTGEPQSWLARAHHCEQARKGAAAGQASHLGSGEINYGKADYFQETAMSHDLVQEWAWLARLHQRGAILWRGQPGRGAETDGRSTHLMEP